ncbi:MAG: DUF262 domain-containing protein [Acidobacteriota bacterium]|nr:DUF262 domain-containing protein [Acidobacteriota bacterium]
MKGNVVDIYKVFDGSEKKLVIPVYQRNYDWTTKQCERLFDDIEEMIAEVRPKHFFGAIVGNPEDSFKWVVIDGQQRMTTVSLLMLALVHAIEAGELEAGDAHLGEKLMRSYLEVNDGYGQKFKLKPVKDDRASYAKLFGPRDQFNEESRITANYHYFRKRLKSTSHTAKTLWDKGISRLEVMLLDLEKHDDPQRIFESLNSTGLTLKESDKIRNFILMELSENEQTEVYEKYWNEMEKNVSFDTDRFIRWYLVAQTAKTPKESDVFETFKSFVKKSGRSRVEIARDLHEFSILMRDLESAKTGYEVIDRRLARANMVLGDVVKPLVWLSYRDVKRGEIDANDFAELVAIIETYIFRRAVASVPTNALNKIFASAYGEMRKLRKNDERYSDILIYMLQNRAKSGRFPDDDEFIEAFKTRDFYRMRPLYRTYLFDFMESGWSKDVVDIAGYLREKDISIEHIMPQTLSPKWREELGPEADSIHARWVNRAANLTITGYNSEYSNLPFEKKLTMSGGFQDSPYFLNSFVGKQERWGIEQLEQRNELLAERALKIWPSFTTSFEPEKEVLPFEPMGLDTDFTGREIVAVEVEGVKTPVSTWGSAAVIVLRALLEVDRDAVLSVVPSIKSLTSDNVEALVATNKKWRQVDPALGLYISTNTVTKIGMLRRVCDAVDYDPDEVFFYLRPEKTANGEAEDLEENDESPYEELIALKPLVDELAGSVLTPDETLEVRDRLSEIVPEFALENPQKVLGGRDLDSFLAERKDQEITVEEALACLSLYQLMSSMMGSTVWHDAILRGNVGTLLGALKQE